MDIDYSKREIDAIINGVTIRFSEHLTEQDKVLVRIEAQTTKTNGSVASLQKWKERSMGALTIVIVVVIPILAWSLIQLAGINDKVRLGVRDELSNYNIVIKND